jgi:UDP-N-acetylglucosamine 2-epimerase (non-hydrolysing)
VTISHGTNKLLGDEPRRLREVRLSGLPPTPCVIPLWDGHAAERAADAIVEAFPVVAQAATAAVA